MKVKGSTLYGSQCDILKSAYRVTLKTAHTGKAAKLYCHLHPRDSALLKATEDHPASKTACHCSHLGWEFPMNKQIREFLSLPMWFRISEAISPGCLLMKDPSQMFHVPNSFSEKWHGKEVPGLFQGSNHLFVFSCVIQDERKKERKKELQMGVETACESKRRWGKKKKENHRWLPKPHDNNQDSPTLDVLQNS